MYIDTHTKESMFKSICEIMHISELELYVSLDKIIR